jgi:lysophospholipase L1-like esterase
MRYGRAFVVVSTAALVVASAALGGSSGSLSGARTYPSSIAVLGHSGATGWNSDPQHPQVDALQNSWATGTNPAVNSIYRRLLRLNPAIKGHAYNIARSGSDVTDLMRQARSALASSPLPELILIQTVDNDMRCDGTDKQNYKPYGAKLAQILETIAKKAPRAHVFIVSVWGSTQNYAAVIQKMPPAARADKIGTGLCDLLDRSNKIRKSAVAAQDAIIRGYHKQIAITCARFRNCRYDQGALYRMVITKSDLSSDGNHLSVHGQRKMAATAWDALY